MPSVLWADEARDRCTARSVGVLLGSFDPPHLGHGWIAEALLDRFEVVALLVPARHFHKTLSYPSNATLEQRLVMLGEVGRKAGKRLRVGLAQEVLYVRLARALRETFPQAAIGFGMGDESYSRMLESPAYFARAGVPWTAEDAQTLAELRETSLVFARHGQAVGLPMAPGQGPGMATGMALLPEALRELSSTAVRARVRRLREQGADERRWGQALSGWVLPQIAAHIATFGLY